ncbi:MAG TPA: hypothetical protein VL361_10775 [Candidatus Limnocylindrales bacterium]|nr:hypothetical protein [Candidatus Limnocylindrales bacterium]
MPRVAHSLFTSGISTAVVLAFILGNGTLSFGSETASNPPFSIQQQGETSWLVKPNGERFFSFGVCCVNQGASREEWDPANPAYAAWQHYSDSNAWAEATLKRLQQWGFTTIGGWSDFPSFKSCPGAAVAFAPVVHLGAIVGAPWWDMWDPKLVERMDAVARQYIVPLRDDPRVIGYYTDNEIGWWNAILFQMTLQQAPASGQRQRLIKLLRQVYHENWSDLMQDFEPSPIIDSWEQLEQHGVLFLRPGGKGIRVERQFLGLLAERYYSLVHDVVRKYDSRALILGDRFPSFFYPEVVRASARYVDVLSSNLNPTWSDGSFPRFYLDTLHALCGKPLQIGEFYMAAGENRSGNKNNHGTYPVVATQSERAKGFSNTLRSLVQTPYVVGADWFQYYDQATHGRFDGENFNFGLVDIHNQPYEPLTFAASTLNLPSLRTQGVRMRPDASQGVPPAPRNPFAQFEPTLALKQWDRGRGFLKPVSEFPLADLYVCWDKNAVYLGLCAQDVVEDVYYRGKSVPAIDRAEWIVSVNRLGKPIRGRIGAGVEPIFDEPSVRAVNTSGLNGNVRNIAGLELPAKLFGKKRFKAGDKIEFSSTFNSHCRAYTVEWQGGLVLRGK